MYKNRYLIGLYDEEDEMVAILDNYRELAEWLEIGERSALSILTKVYQGKQTQVVNYDKKMVYIYLIDMEDEDND